MMYNVAQLLKEAPGTTMDVEVDSDDSLDLRDGEAELAGPVTGSLRLHRTNQGVYVDGTIQADVRLECTRCLRAFTETLTFPLREEFYPIINVTTGAPVDGPHDDDAFAIDQHHQVDLREPIRQALVLALPMKALHSEDCAGLCPHCGKDLNDGPCDCPPEEDARLSALRDLFAQASENGQN
ncbi:MAG: YceD family protein [Ktedonobacterales bacterium]